MAESSKRIEATMVKAIASAREGRTLPSFFVDTHLFPWMWDKVGEGVAVIVWRHGLELRSTRCAQTLQKKIENSGRDGEKVSVCV